MVEPLAALSWLAGHLEGLALGTSILLLALRNPVQVAKQAAFLQEVSGGRFRLGVGVGWHRPEYQYLGGHFEEHGARTEEAIRLLRALWRGEGSFQGRWWSLDGAFFGPIPDPPPPEVWIRGNGRAARRRALTLGGRLAPRRPHGGRGRRRAADMGGSHRASHTTSRASGASRSYRRSGRCHHSTDATPHHAPLADIPRRGWQATTTAFWRRPLGAIGVRESTGG